MGLNDRTCVYPEDPPPQDEGVRFGGVQLSLGQTKALKAWLPPTEDFKNPLEVAGYFRNLHRHTERDGLRVMALLAERGLLPPESDPVEVLDELLDQLDEIKDR